MCIKCQNRLCRACIRKQESQCFDCIQNVIESVKEKCNELKLDVDKYLKLVNNRKMNGISCLINDGCPAKHDLDNTYNRAAYSDFIKASFIKYPMDPSLDCLLYNMFVFLNIIHFINVYVATI